MKQQRIILTALAFVLALLGVSAQQLTKFSSHIVDATTGQSIPYAAIHTAPGRGTMANSNGDFTVMVDSACVLKIRFMGYDELQVKAADLPPIVRMKPATNVMKEVSVFGVTNILKHVIHRLDKEYQASNKNKSQYFCRVNELLKNHHELFETFLNAKSAVNLREISFFSGKRDKISTDARNKDFQLNNINFHHAMELSPMIRDNIFWYGIPTPLSRDFFSEKLEGLYDMSCELLRSSPTSEHPNGKQVYCINMKRKELDSDTEYIRPLMSGKVYVDSKTYQLLQFDGIMDGIFLEVKSPNMHGNTNIALNIHVNYKHDKGYTEVNSLACTFSKKDFNSRILLFNIDNLGMKMKKVYRVGENMLATIDDAGFRDTLWTTYNIVQRTEEEERIAMHDTTNIAFNDSAQQHTEQLNLQKTIDKKVLIERPITPGLATICDNMQGNYRDGQEKVFLHLDNSSYFMGDTIWFAAHTRDTQSDAPSRISGLLYVELLNEEGFLVERKQIRMKQGRGSGYFVLPAKTGHAGFYELRAYTRWQLNWGAYERPHGKECRQWFFSEEMEHRFFTDYEKLYSRVIPVYDAPRLPGEYKYEMNSRRSPTQQQTKKRRNLSVNFYPEGGSLIKGIKSHVAYEARWSDGECAEGTLHIDHQAIPTQNRGRGVFVTKPHGTPQTGVFVSADGTDSVAVTMPQAEAKGVAMHIEQNDSCWTFIMHPSRGFESKFFALSVMHEDNLVVFHPFFNFADTLMIPCYALPEGVCRATAFDNQGEVWADRLFFSKDWSAEDEPTVEIEGIKECYQPNEKIELRVKSPNRNGLTRHSMSISVHEKVDDNKPFDGSNIYTEMLLSSEVRGYIPDARWFFEQNDQEHRTALDLLMMTQGWRRFSWKDVANDKEFVPLHRPEWAPIFSGRVYDVNGWDITDFGGLRQTPFNKTSLSMEEEANMENDNEEIDFRTEAMPPKYEAQVHATLLNPDNLMAPEEAEMRSYDGYFRVRMPDLNHPAMVLISASDKRKWSKEKGFKYDWVQAARDVEDYNVTKPDEFKVCVDVPHPRFVKPYDYYQCHLPAPLQQRDSVQENFGFDTTMKPLNVDARKRRNKPTFDDSHPAFSVDALEAYNNAYDAGMMPDEKGVLLSYLGTSGRDVPLHLRFGKKRAKYKYWIGVHKPDTIYLPQHLESTGSIDSYSPGDIRRFSSLRNRDRYVFYTDYVPRQAADSISSEQQLGNTHMAIYIYHGTQKRDWFRGRSFLIPGFAQSADFYQPDYSQQSVPKDGDHRRTLYWNPHLVMDPKGEATITFYNNSHTTCLSVEAEGQSSGGTLLWNR